MKGSDFASGLQFGRLTAIREEGHDSRRNPLWLCRCDCGSEKIVRSYNLTTGEGGTKSCGCLKLELVRSRFKTHGAFGSRLYGVWAAMIQRCTNPKNEAYADYGGRGISVCERWRNSFESFLADMGDRPTGCTIDRKDNDGNYEPSNCHWATKTQQVRNRRCSVLTESVVLEIHGRCEHGESRKSVCARLKLKKGTVDAVRSGKTWPEFAQANP